MIPDLRSCRGKSTTSEIGFLPWELGGETLKILRLLGLRALLTCFLVAEEHWPFNELTEMCCEAIITSGV